MALKSSKKSRRRSPPWAEPLERRVLLALTGQYFDRIDFTELKLTRADNTVDFTWSGAPATGIGADFFSVRWSGQVEPQFSELYTFYVTSDDGARLWVDGRLLIDNWQNQLPTERSAAIPLEAGKRYDIRLDYYEYNLGAQVRLSWSSPSRSKQVIPSSRLHALPQGLRATYFDNADFTAQRVTRIDSTVNFNWGNGSPDSSIGPDTFSARWTGYVVPQFSETYTFRVPTDADATSRLRVGGQLVVDSTSVQDSGEIKLEAGKRYDLVLEYAENTFSADVQLRWRSPSQVEQVIPSTRLFAAVDTAIPTRRADYTNSVLNADRPDPGVIFADGVYWMVHTTGGPNVGWPLYRSTDMTSWTFVSHLLTSSNKPSYMTDAFWAPEIHKIGNQFVLTGTSWSSQYGRLIVTLATAPEITGPYTVQPAPIVADSVSVLDSHLFQDHDGKVYFLWKRDSNAGTGTFGSIRIREMNASGTAFAPGSSETVILDNQFGGWERNLAEAPWMIRRGDYYYLFYSGAFIDTTYAVGVARSTSPIGPFTRNPANPIITSNATWGGPGHGGLALDVDGVVWHLYHARPQSDPGFGRVQMLDRVVWGADGWPTFGNGGTPSTTQQPGPRVHAATGAGRYTITGDALGVSNDTFLLIRNAADTSRIDLLRNGSVMLSVPFREIERLTLDGGGGNDVLVLDYTRGDPVPGAGVSFFGSGGNDTIRVIGAEAIEPFRVVAGRIYNGTGHVTHTGVEHFQYEGGTFHLNADVNGISVAASAAADVRFNVSQHVPALTLSSGAIARLAAGGNRLIRTSALSITGGARLDLADNDLIVDYSAVSPVGTWTGSDYSGVSGYVASGRNGGTWNGAGIVTSMPEALSDYTTLAVAEASQALGIVGLQTATFAGETVDATTILVKYTYGGDANLDGQLNIDDYGQIDFHVGLSGIAYGFFNGDFNYDGLINIDDYGILDFNLPIQGPPK